MASILSRVYIQLILAVKDSEQAIQDEWKGELYEHLREIVENYDHQLLAVAGTADHVHLFIAWQHEMSPEDLVKKIKTQSTKFVNENKWLKTKALWQDGFGAFSYGHSQIEAVLKYLENQTEYHKLRTFKEEYINFLNKFDVDYTEEDLFE